MSSDTNQPEPGDPGALPPEPPRPRPLLVPAVTFIVGITVSEFLGTGPTWIWWLAFGLPIVVFAALLLTPVRSLVRGYVRTGLVIVAALAFGYARHQTAIYLPPNHVVHYLGEGSAGVSPASVLTRLAGQIVTTPTTAPAEKRNPFLPFDPPARTRFILAARALRTTDPPTAISGYVRVNVEAEAIDAGMGDTVMITGWLYRPRGPRNPGEPNWAHWNRLQGIYAGLAVEGPQYVTRVQGEAAQPQRLVAALRGYAQSLLFEPFAHTEADDAVRLLDTMVLAHRSAAGRRLNEAFLRVGGMHFLAASGFHVGVLAGVAWVFTRYLLRRSSRTTALVTMVVMLVYVVIAESNAPILRATVMGVLGCLALACRRQRPFCPINWLSLSALCILAYNPLELFRGGFQLSFIQVFVLVTVLPRLYDWWLFYRRREDKPPAEVGKWHTLVLLKLWRWVAGLALVCGCAWVTALPLVLYHFQRFAPWGALQSVLISPLVILTIVLGFLTIVGGWIPVLGSLLGGLLRVATGWLLAWVDGLTRLPRTLVEVHAPPGWLVLATYATALLLIGWLWQERPVTGGSTLARLRRALRVQGTALAVAGLALLWTGWLVLSPRGTGPGYAVHVLAVGSGDAILVTAPNRHAVLIDAGTMANFDVGETTACAMRALGVKTLPSLVISHANFDHFSGVPTVVEEVGVERMLVNPYFEQATATGPAARQLAAALPPSTPPPTVIQAGDRLALGQASLEVLWPPDDLDDNWNINDRSLVIRLRAHRRSVLFPGDVERSAIRALLAAHDDGRIDLRSDVLIAPHHGSVIAGDTAAFYAAVSPTVIVVSTAKERPRLAPLVRETLGNSCRLISTRDAGAVTVRITPAGELIIDTYGR